VYLNEFSDGLVARDMSDHPEFASLKQSAAELGISFSEGAGYASRNTVIRHQRFHFLEWGDVDKPTLILLHGSNQSAHSWDLVSLHLASRYHVLALDQRGHGDSEWNRGAHYTIADMALDVEHFIAAEGLTSPVVCGHSMGGMVTLALARSRPDLMKAAVIVDMGPETNDEGTRMIREFVGRNIEFDDMEEFLDRVVKYDAYRSREHIRRTLKYNLIQRADGKFVTKHDRRRYLVNEGGKARVAGVPGLDELAKLPMPLLVVRGGESKVLTADAASRFVDAVPTATLRTVPDCGHNVASQNTAGFLDAVVPFLDGLG
jgi:esterase